MTKPPRITGEEMTRALAHTGFAVVRVRGSHEILRHSDGRVTVIPTHAGETIGPGLLSKILRGCELTCDEFARLL
jgi:predicted RNA binding protein YcfA (HicA-like mRNA interferase family)